MGNLREVPRPVTVTEDTTLEAIAETIGLLNAEVKAMSRRGYIGTRTAEYAQWHARLNDVLDDYEAKAHARA